MKILDKIQAKAKDLYNNPSVTIAFLGDSITQGCFECYYDENETLQTVFDGKSGYPTRVKEILNYLYPSVQINLINSGISGDWAANGNMRFSRDIAPYKPDLVVVSFGANDSCQGKNYVEEYTKQLKEIFDKVKKIGAECVFVFQNMMNTKTSCHLKDVRERDLAKTFADIQNGGTFDCFYEEAKSAAKECGVAFCDVYSAWKRMYESGVDTTELLANKFNHPVREMHYYTALKVVETIFEI